MTDARGFKGHIGRTHHDSVPAWPEPPAGLGGPNVVMIVLDDTGFSHFGCYGSTLATPTTGSPQAACATPGSTRPRCAPQHAPA